eukprot:COSAG01_NODE_5761_length_4048_cov_8.447962_4_plen_176_part_00
MCRYRHDDSALSISSTGMLNEAGADVSGQYVVTYPRVGSVVAHITREYPLPNETWLYGTAGHIRLNSTWGPSALELNGQNEEVPFLAPSPLAKAKWSGVNDSTTWRSGLAHEIIECMECIGSLFCHCACVLKHQLTHACCCYSGRPDRERDVANERDTGSYEADGQCPRSVGHQI